MMRSKTMKGLVNLSQKILNCWASRTDAVQRQGKLRLPFALTFQLPV
jgi:hypothetical protein